MQGNEQTDQGPKLVDKTEYASSQSQSTAESTATPSENAGDNDSGVVIVNSEAMAKKLEENRLLREKLESRSNAFGNPNATIADPHMVRVEPRYTVVQNQSRCFLLIPDLKTNSEDMGLALQPGEAINLTDFYSPMEINRSKGLRNAATKMAGLNGNFMLVPIKSEADAANFKVPEKTKHAKGDTFEDTEPNDFDQRFEEMEMKEAKQEEKLMRKTLAGRTTRQHGAAPAHI